LYIAKSLRGKHESLSLEGILVFSFEQLVQFAQQVKLILGATTPAHFGAGGDELDADGVDDEVGIG
jgi:hypothetical protein